MSNDVGKYRREPPDIVARVLDLARRVERLERTPRLGTSAINSGALIITDATGDVRMRVGLLSDGTYGMEVKEDGQNNFHQVPYVYTQTVPATPGTGETCSSTTYTDLATFGPSVTVPVRSSKRMLIVASAQIQWTTSASGNTQNDGRFDVEFSGANTRSPNETNDPLVGVTKEQIITSGGITNSTAHIITVTAQAVFEGLNVGSTTITMKYRNPQAATNTSDFFRRTLTVITL